MGIVKDDEGGGQNSGRFLTAFLALPSAILGPRFAALALAAGHVGGLSARWRRGYPQRARVAASCGVRPVTHGLVLSFRQGIA